MLRLSGTVDPAKAPAGPRIVGKYLNAGRPRGTPNVVHLPARKLAPLLLRLLAAPSVVLSTVGCHSGERVIISEFLAANGKSSKDRDGDTSDWIELFNQEQAPVSLAGWCLTDDPRTPSRWCFPEVSIPAQGYLVVFASGKRQLPTQPELHATFKLKSTADYLALVRPRGSIASEFSYPDQKQDVSFGLSDTGAQGFLDAPTPAAANGAAWTKKK